MNNTIDPLVHDTSTEHEIRVKKVEELRKQGIEPWPGNKPITATCAQVVEEFEQEGPSAVATAMADKSTSLSMSGGQAGSESESAMLKKQSYAIAGRLMSRREHGKTIFGHLQDRTGKVQLYLKKDILGEDRFKFFTHYIDLGDILWVAGTSFKTKTGEVTLQVEDVALLSKCLHPLPEKFHGITDIETKYRHRYLDLMSSPETRERFIKRSRIIQLMRSYLDRHDFLEVETPMLHPIPGGAAARPFITHHNALDMDFYLRIAPELYLKRLVVGGLERVYEINRNFRNEGVSTRHNPEFTMLEMYMAYQDYHYIMQFVEFLFRELAQAIVGSTHVMFGEYSIDFSKPFDRISAAQAIVKYSSVTQDELDPAQIDSTLKKLGVKLTNTHASYNQKVFTIFEEVAEKKLIQPTFIIDYPIELSPLAQRDPQKPAFAARFELFIAGMEISNGFNELNDPFDQAERFKEQVKAHAAGDEEAMRYDADYVHALEYGLPPTVGVGIGIDRLVMLLTNTVSIKEVILFPALKRKDQ